jgi:hypothetical protein
MESLSVSLGRQTIQTTSLFANFFIIIIQNIKKQLFLQKHLQKFKISLTYMLYQNTIKIKNKKIKNCLSNTIYAFRPV